MPTEEDRLPLLLTIAAACHELSCCARMVRNLADAGELELVKLGRKSTRITRDSVLRVAGQRGKPSTGVPGLKQFETR